MVTSSLLAMFGGWVEWWQLVLLIVLIGIIIFWVRYRRKQM